MIVKVDKDLAEAISNQNIPQVRHSHFHAISLGFNCLSHLMLNTTKRAAARVKIRWSRSKQAKISNRRTESWSGESSRSSKKARSKAKKSKKELWNFGTIFWLNSDW